MVRKEKVTRTVHHIDPSILLHLHIALSFVVFASRVQLAQARCAAVRIIFAAVGVIAGIEAVRDVSVGSERTPVVDPFN
jgi:hypothetical protein